MYTVKMEATSSQPVNAANTTGDENGCFKLRSEDSQGPGNGRATIHLLHNSGREIPSGYLQLFSLTRLAKNAQVLIAHADMNLTGEHPNRGRYSTLQGTVSKT